MIKFFFTSGRTSLKFVLVVISILGIETSILLDFKLPIAVFKMDNDGSRIAFINSLIPSLDFGKHTK